MYKQMVDVNKEIARKLSGYKQQDKKNEIYGDTFFVTVAEVVDLMEDTQYKCTYCTCDVRTNYVAKDRKQWTLDRIDNRMGHNRGNIVLSCLDCNLKRRNICSSDKYRFTKQLKVVCLGKEVNKFERQVWSQIKKI
jgi:hypothetical protein